MQMLKLLVDLSVINLNRQSVKHKISKTFLQLFCLQFTFKLYLPITGKYTIINKPVNKHRGNLLNLQTNKSQAQNNCHKFTI